MQPGRELRVCPPGNRGPGARPSPGLRAGRAFGEQLCRKAYALLADPGPGPSTSPGMCRVRLTTRHAGHPQSTRTLTPAESAAAFATGRDRDHGRDSIGARRQVRDDRLREPHAAATDLNPRTSNRLARVSGRGAKRARAGCSPALEQTLAGGEVDHLVHALIAKSEPIGDFAHRATVGVQKTDRVLVDDPGLIGLVLKLQHPVASAQGSRQQLLIQALVYHDGIESTQLDGPLAP